MKLTLPLAASSGAQTDQLLLGLVGVSVAVLALVFGLMGLYIIRYRHNSPIDRGVLDEKTFGFEISWTIATLVVFFGLFIWGSVIYVRQFQPLANALKIYVVGKQWMWKIEHAGASARSTRCTCRPIRRSRW
jgi:cytochrome c oxidase subunit II